MIIQTADGDPRRLIYLTSSSSKISLTPHTQNPTNSVGLQIGMMSLATIVGLLSVSRIRKISVGEELVGGVEEMATKHLEVELRARLRISMSRTSQASPLSIIRRLPLVEAVDLLGEEVCPEAVALIHPEATRGADEVVSILEEVANVVRGEDGGIGKRFVSFIFTSTTDVYLFQNNRTRESSVAISPQWAMLEEIEFHRLAKLRLEVDDPEDLWVSESAHAIFADFISQRNIRTSLCVRKIL